MVFTTFLFIDLTSHLAVMLLAKKNQISDWWVSIRLLLVPLSLVQVSQISS